MPTIPPYPLSVRRAYTVVDVEATSEHSAEARVVEVAAVKFRAGEPLAKWSTLVNPGVSIPPESSALHLLIDDDVAEAPTLEEVSQDLVRFIAGDVVVAHNAVYDRALLPWLDDNAWLCTLRLSKHLLPDRKRHTNQAMRFALGIGHHPALANGTPHRAEYDCSTTGLVLDRLMDIYLEQNPGATWEDLIAYAASPIPFTKFRWGKHFGQTPHEIARIDPGYLEWVLRTVPMEPHELDAIRAALDEAQAA